MRGFVRLLGGLAALVLLPAAAYAQASIAGVVRDASGAVFPGVTVEASSPALIEKTREAVSDGAGQYRIENLRPGIYSVKFTLSGFSAVSREGVELSGLATVSVNADLKVGSLSETITVTGETPIVDLQSAQRQSVLTNDVIKAIPSSGGYNALLVLVPGVLGGQQDVATGPCNSCTFSAHGTMLSLSGNRANTDGRLLVDGISIAVPQAGGTNYLTDTRNAQEVTFTVTGSMGEVESGGPVMNIVPRAGGNTLSGSGFFQWANGNLQSSNLDQRLKDLNIPESPLIKSYDIDGAVGGPIRRDRAWYFVTARAQGNSAYLPIYYNKNAGDPTQVAVCARLLETGVQRQDLGQRQCPYHRAVDSAQQTEPVLGRAKRVRQLREWRQLRQRHDVAGRQRLRRPASDALPVGELEFSGQQQVAARGRLRLLLLPLGRPSQDRSLHRRPRSHHRAVLGGVCGQRQHSRPDVPLADDGPVQRRPEQEHHHDLALLGVLCHRRQQPEIRLHRQPVGRSPVRQPQPERSAVSHQQRRAEPVDRIRAQPAERPVDERPRPVRAGAVDARPADDSGRTAL